MIVEIIAEQFIWLDSGMLSDVKSRGDGENASLRNDRFNVRFL